ncbi:MAG: undecaprenyl-diphosphate phosphatase [Candidatus Ranarchaeia archaeon]|jgi:undecaprenyl-diphosphatase
MDWILVTFIALLQGLLEWLPVSSEGQIVLFMTNILGTSSEFALSVAIWAHFGTLLTVLIYFRNDYLNLLDFKSSKHQLKLLILVTVGTAVTGIPLRVFLGGIITELQTNLLSLIIGILLMFTGILLWYSQRGGNANVPGYLGSTPIESLSSRAMLFLGLAQGFAILPGVSRSGITLAAAIFLGLSQKESLWVSFFISVPAVLGALGFELLFGLGFMVMGPTGLTIIDLVILAVFALISGLLAMRTLLWSAERMNFSIFCVSFGLLIVIWSLWSSTLIPFF